MIFVCILDFVSCKTEVISLNETDNVEEKLVELGYRLSDISYMVSNNLQISINV